MRAIDADALSAWLNERLRCCNKGSIVEACLFTVLDMVDSMDDVSSSPNEALTLEQLREMEKEPGPIYIPGLGWRICYGVENFAGRSALMVGVTARIYLDNYGDGFIAYRRKPEEEPK